MNSLPLLQVYLVTSSSPALYRERRLNSIISALSSRTASRTTSYLRGRRRHHTSLSSAPSIPLQAASYYYISNQRPRLKSVGFEYSSIRELLKSLPRAEMGVERRLSRASPQAPVNLDAVLNASSIDLKRDRASTVTAYSVQTPPVREGEEMSDGSDNTDTTLVSMPPQPVPRPTHETSDARSICSSSSASRHANRLSLTLPIAPPNSLPSRPTPTVSTPPTPIETSALSSPPESDDPIIAIAAQERRVLELREELARAEGELKRLQRQWTSSEGCKKRPPNSSADTSRGLGPAINLRNNPAESLLTKPHSELERRKAVLLAQSQGPPRHHRRTVIRGGHTRTLSLLSPITSTADLARVNDDHDNVHRSPPDSYFGCSPASVTFPMNKRATWTPLPTSQQSTGVRQLASDFRQGLWTFVEDLRQAAIGDEAISGTTHRTAEMGLRSGKAECDQNTIRASTANRGRIPLPAELLNSPVDSSSQSSMSTPSDRFQQRRRTSRPEPRTRKHFSWTPLTFDNFNEDDWSKWDPNVKPSRWSGSTVAGDAATVTSEKGDEGSEDTLVNLCSSDESGPSPVKSANSLEDAMPHTTSNAMEEWEKSLLPPPQTTTFEAGLQDFTKSAQ